MLRATIALPPTDSSTSMNVRAEVNGVGRPRAPVELRQFRPGARSIAAKRLQNGVSARHHLALCRSSVLISLTQVEFPRGAGATLRSFANLTRETFS